MSLGFRAASVSASLVLHTSSVGSFFGSTQHTVLYPIIYSRPARWTGCGVMEMKKLFHLDSIKTR